MNVAFVLNGKSVAVNVEPERRLVDILRENFGLTRAKAGCYSGECGACSVLFDGELACSCLLPAFTVRGSDVVTIEGFEGSAEHAEIVKAFAEAGYRPCSYCVSARVLAVEALLRTNPQPDERDILVGLSGISCQCAGYTSLVKAVALAAESRKSKRRGRRD